MDDDLGGMPTNLAPAAVIPVGGGLLPGRVLAGRYEIVAKLGHGGMGAVFRAHDRELGEDVALKVILPERIRDAGVLDRFRREVKLARKIAHPNVCRVFDMGEDGNLRFLTMEFIAGRSLREILASGPLEPARALSILHQTIQGVAAVHAQGIVHRDLKPDNVMIRDGGQAVVADFGLARAPTGDVGVSNFAGTPAYMSPEQLRGELLDARSDIFAMGIVAYELLTGRLPFRGESIAAIAAATLRDPPAPLDVPMLSEPVRLGIAAAINRALEKKPEARFGSILEFGDALVSAGAEHSAPTVTGPLAPTGDRRSSWGGVVAAAIGLVVIAGFWFRSWSPVTRAPQAPVIAPAPSASVPLVQKNPQAENIYRQAMDAMHDGDEERAIALMERAVAIDPEFGAAELRLAIWELLSDPIKARGHQLSAVRLRQALAERDAAILHAMDAWLQQPPDVHAWETNLEALAAKYPEDAEVLLLVAGVRIFRMRLDAAIQAATRVLELDSTNVVAWYMKAEALSLAGDTKGQFEAYRGCLAAMPTAAKCLRERIGLRARLSECMLMKEDAKSLLALEPNAAATHRFLASALESTGERRESVVDALEKSFSLQSGRERTHSELAARASLAILDGDFESAVRYLEQRRTRAATENDQQSHAIPSIQLALVYLEMGLSQKADEAAVHFLGRKEAWLEDVDNDFAIKFAVVRLLAGTVTEEAFEKQRVEGIDRFRKKWLGAGRKENEELEWLVWALAYGLPAETRQAALVALEKMPRTKGPVIESGRLGTDFFEGKVYALAGDFDKAIAPLQRAADACNVFSDPMTPTHARFYLGMALRGKGDEAGARNAFQRVIDRWGKAKPLSVTAERAKEALEKLGTSDKPVVRASSKPTNPFGTAIDTRR